MTDTAGRPPGSSRDDDLLMVEGMFCAACAASLEHRLARLPGVADAAVDLAAGAALLRWQPGRADTDAAYRAVADLGYTARRVDESATGASVKDAGRSLQFKLAIALFFGMWTMLPSIALYLDAAPTAAVAHGLAWAAALASFPVIVFAGRPFYAMALATLRSRTAGIDTLVTLGVLGALALSLASLARGGSEVYFEVAVALITLQLLARLIELGVLRRGRDAVARLLELAPASVMRLDEYGDGHLVAVGDVSAGDVLVCEPGDRLAVDGVARSNEARLDRHALTGESAVVSVKHGDVVFAGDVVVEGPLRLRVTAAAGDRRIDALARQVRTLLMHKPDWQRGIDVIARHFLLLAAAAAAAGALLAAAAGADAFDALVRALAVFVIACPCALSLAAPLTVLAVSRRAAGAGMLVRDLRAVTRGDKVDVLFVDKTGTLTEGRPAVHALRPAEGVDELELLAVAAAVEKQSRHPFAVAIVRAARSAGIVQVTEPEPGAAPATRRTLVGRGVSLSHRATALRVGSAAWFADEGLVCPPLGDSDLSRVWVARGDRVLGAIDLNDPLRAGVGDAIDTLQRNGVTVTMLSGDAAGPVARLAERLGIVAISRCSPEEKVERVIAAAEGGAITAFIGDGLNDGPAIAAADLGIAVESALDAARTASAVTLLRGGVERVPELLTLLAAARRSLRQNIGGAMAYNLIAIPAALFGWVHPAVAAVAMAASSITVLLNSLRLPVAAGPDPVSGRDAQRPPAVPQESLLSRA